jgi:transposase
VEGCKYDFSVIATVIAMKYAFHQPTYRQQDWYAQCGWFPSRSTINDLINYGVTTVAPLVAQMWQLLLRQSVMLIDETLVQLLTRGALSDEQLAQIRKRKVGGSSEGQVTLEDRSCPGSVRSYAWLFTSLDAMAPYNVFHWSLTRQQSTLDEMLSAYRGTIVADAYDAYVHVYERSEGRITHASCNSHARREFVEVETYEPILCAQIISLYRQLYDIEDRIASFTEEARLEVRQRESVPIWRVIDAWRHSDRVVRAALPSSPFGKAVGYLANQWDALRRYLHDGALPISNDQTERTIRPLTVGRRNWMFLGHPAAAPGRMQLLSVVSSAHRHHLVVEDYLRDILFKLADAQQNHPHDLEVGSPYLVDLLPDRWGTSHPESVRSERVAEKRDVTEARRVRRAKRRLAQRAKKLAAQRSQPQTAT